MSAKTERWSIRVTAEQDTIVRTLLHSTGMSLNEYVVRSAVTAAANDLADRRAFVLSASQWDELQQTLDRPPTPAPRLAELLSQRSILDAG